MQPISEAYEAEERCFHVAGARILMLPHLAATSCCRCGSILPQQKRSVLICSKPVDQRQHHCDGCKYGGGVDRRHAAVARCLADVIHSHSCTNSHPRREQWKHARMDLVFHLNGSVTNLDVSIVAPFSCNPSLVAAASTRPGHMARGLRRPNLTDIHTATVSLSSLRLLSLDCWKDYVDGCVHMCLFLKRT